MAARKSGRKQFSDEERAAYREQKQAEADALVGEIVGMFTTGELPDLIAQTMIVRAEGTSPISTWSMGNQLLAIKAGTTDARGFRQWEEVGRHVKKGSRAFRIFAPIVKKREEQDATTGETRERSALVGYRLIPVFRIQDTDGEPLEAVDYAPPKMPPLFDVAERLGLSVSWMPAHALAPFRGFYAPDSREIALLTHDVRTFFHELAHAAHDRVLRDAGRGTINDVAPADAEIVAETVAACLCHLYGHDGYLWHGAKYVEHFAEGANPGRAAMRVLGDIQKTLYLLLEPVEESAALADDRELVAA